MDAEAVRRDYEGGARPVPAILEKHRITRWWLAQARYAGGWTPRPPGARLDMPPAGMDQAEARLSRMLANATAMLERKMDEEGVTEANARRLTELSRAQEIRMRTTRASKENAKTRETKNKNDANADYRSDPAWLRAELERRILRIRQAAGLDPEG